MVKTLLKTKILTYVFMKSRINPKETKTKRKKYDEQQNLEKL